MNLNQLTNEELIKYVLKHDTDPIRVRLAEFMYSVLSEFWALGMNIDSTFESKYDSSHRSMSEHIMHLESELDYANEQINELTDEVSRLSTRTVVEFIKDVSEKMDDLQRAKRHADDEAYRLTKELDDTKSKLNTWAILNK